MSFFLIFPLWALAQRVVAVFTVPNKAVIDMFNIGPFADEQTCDVLGKMPELRSGKKVIEFFKIILDHSRIFGNTYHWSPNCPLVDSNIYYILTFVKTSVLYIDFYNSLVTKKLDADCKT